MNTYYEEMLIHRSQYLKFCEDYYLNEKELESANLFVSHSGLDGIFYDEGAFINNLLDLIPVN